MPRSIRLTKNHRLDIIKNVMENWEKQNPAPSVITHKDICVTAIKDFIAGGKKLHPRDKEIREYLMDFIKFKEATKVLPKGKLDKFYKNKHNSFFILVNVVNANNEQQSSYELALTPHTVETLGLGKYVSADTCEDYFYGRSTASRLLDSDPDIHKFEGDDPGATLVVHTINVPLKITIAAEHPLLRQMRKDRQEINKWEKLRNQVEEEFSDYLDQFNTTNQIREGWEELLPFLPGHLADPEQVIKLPAIAKSRLNERLGL